MNKIQWGERSSALRELLRELRPQTPRGGSGANVIREAFGALYSRDHRIWHIFNLRSNNCIATVKFVEASGTPRSYRVIVRYRPNSWYSGVLSSWNHAEYPTARAKTANLGRRGRWVRDGLQPLIRTNLAHRPNAQTVAATTTFSLQERRSNTRFLTLLQRNQQRINSGQRLRNERGLFLNHTESSFFTNLNSLMSNGIPVALTQERANWERLQMRSAQRNITNNYFVQDYEGVAQINWDAGRLTSTASTTINNYSRFLQDIDGGADVQQAQAES